VKTLEDSGGECVIDEDAAPVHLDGEAENGDNTVQAFIFPSDRTAAVRGVIPEAGARRVKSSSRLLHDCAIHYVLEWLLKPSQSKKAPLNNRRGPLTDLGVGVGLTPDNLLDCLLHDPAHLVSDELGLFIKLIHG